MGKVLVGYPVFLSVCDERGFEPTEGEVVVLFTRHGSREDHVVLIAILRQTFDSCSAGITQTKVLGNLVKGFARRIISGTANYPVLTRF